MVLIVLRDLNWQNKEGRSQFDKGSTDREKWEAKRLIKRVSEQEMVCGKYWSFDWKKIDNCGSAERKSGSGRLRS